MSCVPIPTGTWPVEDPVLVDPELIFEVSIVEPAAAVITKVTCSVVVLPLDLAVISKVYWPGLAFEGKLNLIFAL